MPVIKTLKNGRWTPCTTIDDLPLATQSNNGIMSSIDKSKLDNVTDYIVEIGTFTDGYYEKWNSGLAKIYMTVDVNTSAGTASTNGWYTDPVYVDLPITLTKCYGFTTCCSENGFFAVRYGNLASMTTRVGIRVCATRNITAGAHTVTFDIKGRWK